MKDKKIEPFTLETVGFLHCLINCEVLLSLLKEKGVITDKEYQDKYELVSQKIIQNMKRKAQSVENK